MSLISRLGRRFREKPKSTNLNLPALPTPREIMEDIESCQGRDPIISFANLIQKKGRQSLLDSDFLEDTSPSSQESQLSFLSPYKTGSSTSSSTEEPPVPGKAAAHPKSKGSSSTAAVHLNLGATGRSSSSKKLTTDVEQINNYNQLKQFLLLYEKSEELLENIEPHFKRVEETLRTCEAYANPPENEDVENCRELDNDGCSSPLL